MTLRLVLVVPGLAQALSDPEIRLLAPYAQRLSGGRRGSPEAALTLETWWAAHSHWDGGVPVAALETGESGYWLRADPVHLRLDQRDARLLEASELALTAAQAKALWATCAAVFAEHGGELRHLQPACWAAQFAAPLEAGALSSLRQVRGQSVRECLAQGAVGRAWRKLFSDLQVALHVHPINQAREAVGLPAINSLWLWGGGVLETYPLAKPPWDALWTDIGWLAAWARRCGIPVHSAALGLSLAPKATVAVVLEALEAPLAYGDGPGLVAVMTDYERLWFAPLWQALRRSAVRQLILHPLPGACYRLRPWHCWW